MVAHIEERPLGRSGLKVTALGFGGGPIGNLGLAVPDEDVRATIDAAWSGGVRYFDTAPLYGRGLSERRLGAVLRDSRPRDSFVLSTKVGRRLNPPDALHTGSQAPEVSFDYSYAGALASFEESLDRLGLERADILLIHDIDRWTHGDKQPKAFAAALDGAYRALDELKSQGRVSAVGLGVNEWEVCLDFAQRAPIDCVLLAGRYTLLEQEAGRQFLPYCLEHGIGVIVGGPFNSGILATGARPDAQFNYSPAPQAILDRVRRIEFVVARHGVALPSAALAFPLRHPAVSAIIPGVASADEASRALAAVKQEIPEALWHDLAAAGLIET